MTFSNCLNHFRGSDFYNELDGMRGMNEYIKEKNINNKDEEYFNCFKYFINHYEKIIFGKKGKKRKEKNSLILFCK